MSNLIRERFFTLRYKKNLNIVCLVMSFVGAILVGALVRLMVVQSDYYQKLATAVWERERSIKASRGIIYDRNGVGLATNKAVCTISVIHSQLEDEETVIKNLTEILEMDEDTVREKVTKVSSREKIKSNVEKEIADKIIALEMPGVTVDEDYKRYYPYNSLMSNVLGFTGSDNQGIVGLEVYYDDVLMGENGSINTITDAGGIDIEDKAKRRITPQAGDNLVTTIDANIQSYYEALAARVMYQKNAKRVCIISMNPQNGEIYAMAETPGYNLNDPYNLTDFALTKEYKDKEYATEADALNQMWRSFCINDTYEPGSSFKIVTAASAFEEGKVTVNDSFFCPGYKIVEDRKIKCHKVLGHGSETFKEGIMNSCNPVFMQIGERLGAELFYKNLEKLGLFEKTGIDLPGEAGSIFHKLENVGPVELATMSFGQSFQITPLQLLRAASAVVNGGNLVTPHIGKYITDSNGHIVEVLDYPVEENVISEETSDTMRELLGAVVAEGTGKNAYVEGYSIGGKTATSEKLPRGNGKYIASFVGFSPVENPQIITLVLIDEPEGIYYGGTVAAPVAGELYENILPYLNFEN